MSTPPRGLETKRSDLTQPDASSRFAKVMLELQDQSAKLKLLSHHIDTWNFELWNERTQNRTDEDRRVSKGWDHAADRLALKNRSDVSSPAARKGPTVPQLICFEVVGGQRTKDQALQCQMSSKLLICRQI